MAFVDVIDGLWNSETLYQMSLENKRASRMFDLSTILKMYQSAYFSVREK